MALTRTRWIALALTGFFLVPVVVFNDSGSRYEWRPAARDRLVERNRVAVHHVVRVADELRVLQVRDSIRRIDARSPAAAIGVDAAFDSASRTLIATLSRGLADARPPAAYVPVSVFFVLDTATEVRGQPRRGRSTGVLSLDYVLPTDSARRCIVVASVRLPNNHRSYMAELRSVVTRERLLGPCAYFESFGVPGNEIARWLARRGWQFAQRSPWPTPARPWLDGQPDEAYRERIDLDFVMGTAGRACAGGKGDACLAALLEPQPMLSQRTPVRARAGIVSTGFFNPFAHGDNAWLTRSWPLGSREWTLLSDMVRSIGAEQFERFWTSDLPPAQAFQTATGTPLAGWMREWIETTYHPQPTGPALAGSAAGSGALLLVVTIGFAVLAARRRQYS